MLNLNSLACNKGKTVWMTHTHNCCKKNEIAFHLSITNNRSIVAIQSKVSQSVSIKYINKNKEEDEE